MVIQFRSINSLFWLLLALSPVELPAQENHSITKADDPARSLEGFHYIYKISQNRRCMNCHGDQHPWNGEAQNFKPHSMKVSRVHMSGRLGMSCTSCHAQSQSESPGMPPGIAVEGGWRMPPLHMSFSPGMSPRKLCETFLAFDPDPSRKKLLHHADEDPFIIWTWKPGGGRKPSPGTHAQFSVAVHQWLENGAYCPNE